MMTDSLKIAIGAYMNGWDTLVNAFGFRMESGREVWLDKDALPIARMASGNTSTYITVVDSRGKTKEVIEPHKGMRALFGGKVTFLGSMFVPMHKVDNIVAPWNLPHSVKCILSNRFNAIQ